MNLAGRIISIYYLVFKTWSMKKLILVIFVYLLMTACETENEKINVTYRVSNAYAETEVSYRNSDAQIVSEVITFNSPQDIWTYDMSLRRGEIVYISAIYSDSTSSVKLEILMDGKLFKEGSNNNEPGKYLILSGSIPFN